MYVNRPEGDVWKNEAKIKSCELKFFALFSAKGIGELYFHEKMTVGEMNSIIQPNIIPTARNSFGRSHWPLALKYYLKNMLLHNSLVQ